MPKLRFTYFDMKGGRGQVARLLLDLADLEYEDVRISFQDFIAAKARYPYGALPILQVDDVLIAQCNGINRYLGKLAELYPTDPLQAALCDEIMSAVEDVQTKVSPTLFIQDEDEKKSAREALAAGPIKFFLERIAARLEEHGGSYFADGRLTVADLKVFVWVKSLQSGLLDYIPTDLVDKHGPALSAHYERVWALPKIRAHYE